MEYTLKTLLTEKEQIYSSSRTLVLIDIANNILFIKNNSIDALTKFFVTKKELHKNGKQLRTAIKERIDCAVKLYANHEDLIDTMINEAKDFDAFYDHVINTIIKTLYLPSPDAPLRGLGVMLPMLIKNLSAKELRLAEKAAKAAKVTEEAEVMEGEAEAMEGEAEEADILPNPQPLSYSEELEAAITRFYEIAKKVKHSDIESLARIANFIHTLTNADLTLANVHDVKTAQGVKVEFMPYNEGLCSMVIGVLKAASVNHTQPLSPAKKNKKQGQELIPQTAFDALSAKFA